MLSYVLAFKDGPRMQGEQCTGSLAPDRYSRPISHLARQPCWVCCLPDKLNSVAGGVAGSDGKQRVISIQLSISHG